MNLQNGPKQGRTGELRPLSRAARVLLLEAAVLDAYGAMGVPLNAEAERVFQSEIDARYLASLIARRPVGGSWFRQQARIMAIAARSGM